MTLTATCQNGQPLAILSDLIGKRMRVLREHGKDAVVAAAIDVVKSVRAATLDARKTRKFEIKVGPTQWHGSWYVENGAKRRCLRDASGRKTIPPVDGIKCVWYDDEVIGKSPVFLVENDQKRRYYIACKDYSTAYNYEKIKTLSRIERSGTTAKNAWSVAMHLIAINSPALEGSSKAKAVVQHLVKKVEIGDGNHFGIHVEDNLGYALEAVKGGQSGIDLAYKKAANKISGMLAQAAKKHGLFEEFPTPFPEVKRRR